MMLPLKQNKAFLFWFTCLLITAVHSLHLRIKREENYCYSKDANPYIMFGSLTAYELSRSDVADISIPKGCKPVTFWSLNRHGTRYPSESEIRKFSELDNIIEQVKNNYKQQNVKLCEEDYRLLQSWTWNTSIDASKAKFLAPQGYRDLQELAERFKKRFPALLGAKYSEDYYYFQHTSTERTKSSFEAYVKGLFGPNTKVKGNESDSIIKEYAHCNRWRKQVDGNKEVRTEYHKFTMTQEYEDLRERVSKRLGFSTPLEGSVILAMYLDCAFEKAWYVTEPTKWCTAFTKDDLKFLEYGGDLLTYYKNSYGSEYNTKMGCPLIRDIYDKFDRKTGGSKEKQPTVTAFFTHSTAYDQFITTLGLRKDENPLLGTNYNEQQKRQWRISNFGPFATNFVAILYHCEDYNNEYKIQILEDEKPLDLYEGCIKGLCSWRTFKEKFKMLAHNCSLDFCNM